MIKTKTKVFAITDDTVKKKKKVSVVVAEPKSISKLQGKALKTMFGQHSEKILQMLESSDSDPAIALIYKRLLQSIVDLLPLSELAIRSSKGTRGVYPYIQLVSSIRELMVDISAAQDRGMLGTSLMESVVKPAFSDMASDIVQEYSMIGADA
jgi:hypothetical protein